MGKIPAALWPVTKGGQLQHICIVVSISSTTWYFYSKVEAGIPHAGAVFKNGWGVYCGTFRDFLQRATLIISLTLTLTHQSPYMHRKRRLHGGKTYCYGDRQQSSSDNVGALIKRSLFRLTWLSLAALQATRTCVHWTVLRAVLYCRACSLRTLFRTAFFFSVAVLLLRAHFFSFFFLRSNFYIFFTCIFFCQAPPMPLRVQQQQGQSW